MSKAKKVRVQKFLSELGIASRRAVEEMVLEGRISVNGRTRTKLPVLIYPGDDEIRLDGLLVDTTPPDKVYYLLNKPQGTVCTQQDQAGRRRAIDLIKDAPRGVHCVGRLDMDSTGLIVMTNDGDLTQHLTHPKHGIPKTYVVEIEGRLDEEQMAKLKSPTYLDGRKTAGLKVKSLRRGYDRSVLEITLREGRNREIRRLLARLGHKVYKLRRTAIGAITDRGVKVGNSRPLKRYEVAILFKGPSEEDILPAPIVRKPGGKKPIAKRSTRKTTPAKIETKTTRKTSSRKTPVKPGSRRGAARKTGGKASSPGRPTAKRGGRGTTPAGKKNKRRRGSK
ncbi:MAG: pseudouridine synthase [Phycisphaerales bacterium]|jgi:23S rRNA pseudouridine2605 synthase|nr:pseudouridine synthase [Phycisphaerales bacterium]